MGGELILKTCVYLMLGAIMQQLFTIIKDSAAGLIIAICLLAWGILDEGLIRILLGLLILYISISVSLNDQKVLNDIKNWKEKNKERLVFFYPTNKLLQERIKKIIIPFMPAETLQVYYDGPKLVGDIDPTIIKHLMLEFKQIKVNSPSLFRIEGDRINYVSLEEVKLLNGQGIDFEIIELKINAVASA
jgi:hypothetical protein